MKIHALLYDLARSLRADMDHLKHVIDGLAELDFNMMVVNLEHRFEFPSCPGIAPPGSLTTETARELVAYGKSRGIEVVGQPNVMGHCEGIGATERYAHLSADPWLQAPFGGYEMLNLELPESRELIVRMIKDVCAAFPGDYLHIGGDEVRRMQYLFPGAEKLQQEKRIEYFNFVLELARDTGRQVMMWGDMPLKYETMMPGLPRDVIICDWHYGAEGSRETLARYQKEGFRVLSAPSVSTCADFYISNTVTNANLNTMIGDARELGLEGFLLTTWELGYGTGFNACWPWIALTSEIARNGRRDAPDRFIADFASARYGVNGTAHNRLVEILCDDFPETICRGAADSTIGLSYLGRLRRMLFRGMFDFDEIMREKQVQRAIGQPLWEPSPFYVWVYTRAVLNEAKIKELEALAEEAVTLVGTLLDEAKYRREELVPLLGLGRAFGVLVKRLRILSSCKECYHRAALAQGKDKEVFQKHLREVANGLEGIRPGLQTLKEFVKQLNEQNGYDPGELQWLDIHEQSLNQHIEAVRSLAFDGDSLLEFGEFLRRPANVTQRLTWR